LVISGGAFLLSIFIGATYPLVAPHWQPGDLQLALAFSVGAGVVVAVLGSAVAAAFNYLEGRDILPQVRQAAKAAIALQIEFLNFHPVDPKTALTVFPIVFPGLFRELHVAMLGCVDGQQVVAAYFGFEVGESDWLEDGLNRKMAQLRGAVGRDIRLDFGQFVMMFPEPLEGVPGFALAPADDEYYHLTRYAPTVPLPGALGLRLLDRYQLVSKEPLAVQSLFTEKLIQLLLDNAGWHVQVQFGRLMAWHGRLGGTGTIVPGNSERMIDDMRLAVRLRKMLGTSSGNRSTH
jgi:hypothetical protein